MATIAVFCGSRSGESEAFTREAMTFAETLLTAGHSVVYGGGSTGKTNRLINRLIRRGNHGHLLKFVFKS